MHVLAHFIRPLRGLRDLVFTALAQPVGSIVVYTFWFVWFVMGRELIFPVKLDAHYPLWLNHTTHTLIVPINLLLAIACNHRYFKKGAILTLLYMVGYTVFLHFVWFQTGFFIYEYLHELDLVKRSLYFVATGLLALAMYKLGQVVGYLVHGAAGGKSTPSRKSKAGKAKQR